MKAAKEKDKEESKEKIGQAECKVNSSPFAGYPNARLALLECSRPFKCLFVLW